MPGRTGGLTGQPLHVQLKKRPDFRRALVTLLRHPLAGLAALVLLLGDFAGLPYSDQNRSAVRRWVSDRRPLNRGADYSAYLARGESGSWRVVDTRQESLGDLLSDTPGQPERVVVHFHLEQIDERVGWWAPTLHRQRLRVQSIVLSGSPTDTDFQVTSDRFWSWVVATWAAPTSLPFSRTQAPSLDKEVILWTGYLHNAAAALLFGTVCFSAASFPAYRRRKRIERLLSRGRCPSCKYDITTIVPVEGTTRCPECGAVWPNSGPPPKGRG